MKSCLKDFTYIKEIGLLEADKASAQAPYCKHDDGEAAPLCVPESHPTYDKIEPETEGFLKLADCQLLLDTVR